MNVYCDGTKCNKDGNTPVNIAIKNENERIFINTSLITSLEAVIILYISGIIIDLDLFIINYRDIFFDIYNKKTGYSLEYPVF